MAAGKENFRLTGCGKNFLVRFKETTWLISNREAIKMPPEIAAS
jgi:hypothetical protein